jgi:multidrug resistance efflux pump
MTMICNEPRSPQKPVSRDHSTGTQIRASAILLIILLCGIHTVHAQAIPSGAIEVKDAFLRPREVAEIPALERGQLKPEVLEPGTAVEQSGTLASLDDAEASLAVELARLDLQIAEKEHLDSQETAIAQATLEEAKQLLSQLKLDAEAATRLAAQDISIRQATRDSEVSAQELERAITARKNFSSSVADQQLSKLTLARDQDVLKLEKAQFDQSIEQIRSRSREAMVGQQQSAVQRLERTLAKVRSEHENAQLEILRLQKQVAIAEARLDRRHLKAPFSGVVVEKIRGAGEWVEPGQPVLRMIRLDVLYVEGFVSTEQVSSQSRGQKVMVECGPESSPTRTEGVLIFVSPESDSINRQVRIRAEITNPEQRLLPGEPARMWILPVLAAK